MSDRELEEMCHSNDGIVVRETFDRIGDKWTLLVVGMLADGPLRFTQLRHHAAVEAAVARHHVRCAGDG